MILPLVACCMVFLLSVAAIVLDLGQAVVSGRQMQNASDSAALAGARQLDKVKLSAPSSLPISPSTVDATVRLVAGGNAAESTLVTCTIIRWDQVPLGPCAGSAAVTSAMADGVLVTTGVSKATTFGKVLGTNQLRQDRTAAATIQPLVGQQAPLLVCAFGQSRPAPDIFVATSATGVTPVDYEINQNAVGWNYLAHAPGVADCGLAGSSWKGDGGPGVFLVPGYIDIGTGVQAGPIRSEIAGQPGCGNTTTLECVIALPVCSSSNGEGGSNGQLLCEHFGVFKLVAQTSNTQTFTLLGGLEATAGIGGTGSADRNDARVIKLVL